MSYFMRRQHGSVAPHPRQQRPDQKAFSTSLKEQDGTVKINGRLRRGKTHTPRGKFSWDPDSFCSDSDGSEASDGAGRTSAPPASGIIDLTGKTEPLKNVSPARSHQEVVLLSSGEDEKIWPEELGRSSQAHMSVGKVFLTPQSLAVDTLKALRPKRGAPGRELDSESVRTSLKASRECCDSQLDETSSEGSMVSGPSSPHHALISQRCRDCRSLFAKMRRRGPPNPQKRNSNPASLSCDKWLLIKPWHPQRRRQERGRLWVHLKRIRKLAVELLAPGVTSSVQCSRPHVFLQRNLRHCQRMTSDSKAKPHKRRRPRAKNQWPPLTSKRRVKRKSLESDDALEPPSCLDLSAVSNNTAEDQSANGDAHHTDSQKQETVLKHGPGAINVILDRPAGYADLEVTRRRLKFDCPLDALSMVTQEPLEGIIRSPVKDSNCSMAETVACEEVDEFSTPLDLSTENSTIVRKSRSSYFLFDHSSRGFKRGSFMSMLAAFKNSQNRIIKESHN